MEEMPEIKENDLINVNGRCYQVHKADYDELAFSSHMEDMGDYNWDEEWEPNDEMVDDYVHNFIDEIIAIYRKQGKDYICIWERE